MRGVVTSVSRPNWKTIHLLALGDTVLLLLSLYTWCLRKIWRQLVASSSLTRTSRVENLYMCRAEEPVCKKSAYVCRADPWTPCPSLCKAVLVDAQIRRDGGSNVSVTWEGQVVENRKVGRS